MTPKTPSQEKIARGVLYIVSTPIGNLEDITLRALRILKEVDLICAEDTRKTRILLHHFHITTPLTSFYDHNERYKTPLIIQKLKEGQNIALVSEAGTPTISDPGYRIINSALREAIPVVPVPGPSAAIAALSIAGLPVHRFVFEGFLPSKPGKRKNVLHKLSKEERTIIFYESPHRIVRTLRDLIDIFGKDRLATICRELTKVYEERISGSLSMLLAIIEKNPIKGEITLVVEGYKSTT